MKRGLRRPVAATQRVVARRAGALIALLGLWLAASLAQPQGGEGLHLDLSLWVVTSVTDAETGAVSERVEIALSVEPGALLEWSLVAENRSELEVAGVALELPFPAEVAFVLGSVRLLAQIDGSLQPWTDGFRVEYSADGGESFAPGPLLQRVVVVEDGVEVERDEPLPGSAHSHVRVLLDAPLAAGATAVLQVRSVVR